MNQKLQTAEKETPSNRLPFRGAISSLMHRFTPTRTASPDQLHELFWQVFNTANFRMYAANPHRPDFWETMRWDKNLELMSYLLLNGSANSRAKALGYKSERDVGPGVEAFLYSEKKILTEAATDAEKAKPAMNLFSRIRNTAELKGFKLPHPNISAHIQQQLRKITAKDVKAATVMLR